MFLKCYDPRGGVANAGGLRYVGSVVVSRAESIGSLRGAMCERAGFCKGDVDSLLLFLEVPREAGCVPVLPTVLIEDLKIEGAVVIIFQRVVLPAAAAGLQLPTAPDWYGSRPGGGSGDQPTPRGRSPRRPASGGRSLYRDAFLLG
mmetsp:Transcript_51572/g.164920  ORF Transcript_51572/g.164920 Transcript_51572/m.164920 type:complete len:146 (-) Transcript_51572:201-638(-)